MAYQSARHIVDDLVKGVLEAKPQALISPVYVDLLQAVANFMKSDSCLPPPEYVAGRLLAEFLTSLEDAGDRKVLGNAKLPAMVNAMIAEWYCSEEPLMVQAFAWHCRSASETEAEQTARFRATNRLRLRNIIIGP